MTSPDGLHNTCFKNRPLLSRLLAPWVSGFETERFHLAVWLVPEVGNDWTSPTRAHLLVNNVTGYNGNFHSKLDTMSNLFIYFKSFYQSVETWILCCCFFLPFLHPIIFCLLSATLGSPCWANIRMQVFGPFIMASLLICLISLYREVHFKPVSDHCASSCAHYFSVFTSHNMTC